MPKPATRIIKPPENDRSLQVLALVATLIIILGFVVWKVFYSTRTLFEVSGTVVRAGTPIEVPSCRIVFTNQGTKRIAVGILDDRGNFRVTNPNESGLPVGTYDVVISFPPDYLPPTKSATEPFSRQELEKRLSKFIPGKYRDPRTSGLTLEVKDEDVEFNVDMTD